MADKITLCRKHIETMSTFEKQKQHGDKRKCFHLSHEIDRQTAARTPICRPHASTELAPYPQMVLQLQTLWVFWLLAPEAFPFQKWWSFLSLLRCSEVLSQSHPKPTAPTLLVHTDHVAPNFSSVGYRMFPVDQSCRDFILSIVHVRSMIRAGPCMILVTKNITFSTRITWP